MYIEDLRERLVELARSRVQSGQVTERGLAQLCGISQPHMHNVLKGIRVLSIEFADQLMRALKVNAAELLWQFPAEADSGIRAIAMLRSRIGPGTSPDFAATSGYLPVPSRLADTLVEPIAARLAPDLAMPRIVAPNDTVLLDRSAVKRSKPSDDAVYLVDAGAGLRVRYARVSGGRVFLIDEPNLTKPAEWYSVSLQGRNILDIVRAHIVWIGREMASNPSGPFIKAG